MEQGTMALDEVPLQPYALKLGHMMQRWSTHQLVAGGLLDQPAALWRDIEAALGAEATFKRQQIKLKKEYEGLVST